MFHHFILKIFYFEYICWYHLENMHYIVLEIFSVLAFFHCEFDYFVDFGTSLSCSYFSSNIWWYLLFPFYCRRGSWFSNTMAPHSSTLAWKLPRMEEPGRFQSMASLRVGHDWVTSLSFQYSCLENPMDGGAWWAVVHGVTKSWTRLSDFTSLHFWCFQFQVTFYK